MEQSELSSIIAKLKIAYPNYFKNLSQLEIVGMVELYKENLREYDLTIVNNAIREIIKTYRYMPAISDIVDECQKQRSDLYYDVIYKMKKDGYFNNGTYGDLSDEQANRNFDKALSWLEKGIIPSFLKEDVEAYILTNNDKQIASNERLQIKC